MNDDKQTKQTGAQIGGHTAPGKNVHEETGPILPAGTENSTDVTRFTTTNEAPYNHPYNQGEQSISGTTPDPSSDDDTLQAAHDVGTQLSEDTENPVEIDIARDINTAEQEIRNK